MIEVMQKSWALFIKTFCTIVKHLFVCYSDFYMLLFCCKHVAILIVRPNWLFYIFKKVLHTEFAHLFGTLMGGKKPKLEHVTFFFQNQTLFSRKLSTEFFASRRVFRLKSFHKVFSGFLSKHCQAERSKSHCCLWNRIWVKCSCFGQNFVLNLYQSLVRPCRRKISQHWCASCSCCLKKIFGLLDSLIVRSIRCIGKKQLNLAKLLLIFFSIYADVR